MCYNFTTFTAKQITLVILYVSSSYRDSIGGWQALVDSLSPYTHTQNGITDIFNGFIVEAMVTCQNSHKYNLTPTECVQVETFKDCDGNTCTPNLGLTLSGPMYTYVITGYLLHIIPTVCITDITQHDTQWSHACTQLQTLILDFSLYTW